MKKIVIVSLVLFPLSASLQESTEGANKPCSFQSRELALRAQQEIFPDMTQEQRSSLMALGTRVCMEHASLSFRQVTGDIQPEEPAVEKTSSAEEEKSSWLSDIFGGEMKGGKKGNERLRKK